MKTALLTAVVVVLYAVLQAAYDFLCWAWRERIIQASWWTFLTWCWVQIFSATSAVNRWAHERLRRTTERLTKEINQL